MQLDIWLIGDVFATLLSVVITGLIIPQILLIAFRRKLFDGCDERKIHHGMVPRLGGIAFVPSMILSMTMSLGIGFMCFGMNAVTILATSHPVTICFALCGLMMLYLVGISDDLIGVKYRAKFVIQLLAAVLLVCSGAWINDLNGFCGIYQLPAGVGIALTILVVVFVINSINLIDGIDGLASGLSVIALFCYGSMFFMLGSYFKAMFAFSAMGTLIPFFFFNVLGEAVNKKKIFMGDTGTMTIGFILVFMAISMSESATARVVHVQPIVMAFAPLILPCFDVVRVFVHRIRMKQNPFLPDRCHIHHKLLALGLPQKGVMVVILLWSLLYTVASIFMSRYMNVALVLAIDFGLWVLINWYLTKLIFKRKAAKEEKHSFLGSPTYV